MNFTITDFYYLFGIVCAGGLIRDLWLLLRFKNNFSVTMPEKKRPDSSLVNIVGISTVLWFVMGFFSEYIFLFLLLSFLNVYVPFSKHFRNQTPPIRHKLAFICTITSIIIIGGILGLHFK